MLLMFCAGMGTGFMFLELLRKNYKMAALEAVLAITAGSVAWMGS